MALVVPRTRHSTIGDRASPRVWNDLPHAVTTPSSLAIFRRRLQHWMLQLNADKTEDIWVGSRSNLAKIANSDGSIQVGSSNIQPSTVVRDLDLHLDSGLSMKDHVTKVAAACYYHLRRLRQIRRRMGQEVATRLFFAVVRRLSLSYYIDYRRSQ